MDWGSREEGTKGACAVGGEEGEGGLRIDEKEQKEREWEGATTPLP